MPWQLVIVRRAEGSVVWGPVADPLHGGVDLCLADHDTEAPFGLARYNNAKLEMDAAPTRSRRIFLEKYHGT